MVGRASASILGTNRGADGTFSIALCESCVVTMTFSERGNVAVSNSEVSSE
jgi:hypothetical protein